MYQCKISQYGVNNKNLKTIMNVSKSNYPPIEKNPADYGCIQTKNEQTMTDVQIDKKYSKENLPLAGEKENKCYLMKNIEKNWQDILIA